MCLLVHDSHITIFINIRGQDGTVVDHLSSDLGGHGSNPGSDLYALHGMVHDMVHGSTKVPPQVEDHDTFLVLSWMFDL